MKQTFIWTNQHEQGEIEAKTIHEAKALLLKNNINWSHIHKNPFYTIQLIRKTIKAHEITHCLIQLTDLLSSGIDLLQALNLITHAKKTSELNKVIKQIAHDIAQGSSFAAALTKHQTIFKSSLIGWIQVGEQTGTLTQVLQEIVKQRQQAEQTIQQVKKASIYPAILVVTSIAITILLLKFVVPQFQQFYQNFNHALPIITQLTLTISQLINDYFNSVLIVIFGLLMLSLLLVKKNYFCRFQLAKLIFVLPVTGKLLQHRICMNLYLTLALGLEAGLPITKALHYSTEACNNIVIKHYLTQTKQSIQQGYSLSDSLKPYQFITSTDQQLLMIGETAGTLTALLTSLAAQHNNQLQYTISKINSLIEPCILILLGGVVAFILLAIYLPLFRMGMVL